MENAEREPLYERAGRELLSIDEVEAAIAEWRSDHPDEDSRGIEVRIRRLNDELKLRKAEEGLARRAGTEVWALRQVKEERRAQARRERDEIALQAARRALRVSQPGVVRRPPGRPAWTEPLFHGAYREARDRAGGAAALDKEIAAAWPMSLKRFQSLVRRFGRPT